MPARKGGEYRTNDKGERILERRTEPAGPANGEAGREGVAAGEAPQKTTAKLGKGD